MPVVFNSILAISAHTKNCRDSRKVLDVSSDIQQFGVDVDIGRADCLHAIYGVCGLISFDVD